MHARVIFCKVGGLLETLSVMSTFLHVKTNKVTTSLVCFVAQLVEECTSIAEVMGLTPV